ncbi:MAG: ABC transporter permease [Spirosomataceae bacterium]
MKISYERFLLNFKIGVEALNINKFRAFLTSLGIIFGVAAVIAMLAIGAGAEREILEQIKQVGVNNIVIKPRLETTENAQQEQKPPAGKEEKKRFSPGLTLADAENIQTSISSVAFVSPEIEMETVLVRAGIRNNGRIIGVNNHYFEVAGVKIVEGKYFTTSQLDNAEPVCIIGKNVKAKFFPSVNPIGQTIKCGNNWLTVVGVLEGREVSESAVKKLSIRNLNTEIYLPVRTFLLRYKNRANITIRDMRMAAQQEAEGNNNGEKPKPNYNQLDRLVINVKESTLITPTLDLIEKMLRRRHNEVDDYEIVVPELLLKQEQRTKRLFNIVLGVIASISLLVGGIGIMNIMLASVLERIKEIGLRLALGAHKRDIILQFVSEAIAISFSGGILGIVLGVAISYFIETVADIQTIISPFSVAISFFVAITVGLVFGIFPAKRASEQNPIESLRHE